MYANYCNYAYSLTTSHWYGLTMNAASPKRGRPAVVSVGEIVEAAVELIDRDGVDALTMRSLAASIGIGPMTLYRHLADKDTLLAMLPDALLASVCDEVLRKRSGLLALRTIATGLMNVLQTHPGIATLFEDPEQGPNMKAAASHVINLLIGEGMRSSEAEVALRAVVAQVIGENVTRHGKPQFAGVVLLLDGIRLRLEAN
jgi:TetR/AcrR family tetracycline transcriptional repressor